MKIKVERIHRIVGSTIKAFVDINIEDALLIKGLRILKGSSGLAVSFPGEKGQDRCWYETVRCLNDKTRQQINDVILTSYNKEATE